MMRGVTIVKKADRSLNKDFLGLAMGKYTKCWGISTPANKGDYLATIRSSKLRTADSIFEMAEKYQDRVMILYFGEQGEGEASHEDDFQPFTLLEDADGRPILIAVLEGDFSEFYKKDSSHSPQFFCVNEDLIPRVKKAYNYVNGDIGLLMEELANKSSSRDIANLMVGDRGSVTLYAFGYEPLCYTLKDDTTFKQYDWGWVSNSLGFKTNDPIAEVEDELAELVGGMNTFDGGSDAKVGKPAVVAKAADKPAVPAAVAATSVPVAGKPVRSRLFDDLAETSHVPAAAKPSPQSGKDVARARSAAQTGGAAANGSPNGTTAPVKLDPETILEIFIPINLLAEPKRIYNFCKNRMNAEELKMLGKTGVAGLKSIKAKAGKATKEFMQTYFEQNKLAGLSAFAVTGGTSDEKVPDKPVARARLSDELGTGKPVNVGATEASKPLVKDTTVHNVGDNTKAVGGPLPIIPPSEKGKALDILKSGEMKELVDKHYQNIKDSANFSKMEKRVGTVVQQLPDVPILKSISDVQNWPYEVYLKLMDTPKTLAVLAWNLAIENRKLEEQLTDPSHVPAPKLKEEEIIVEQPVKKAVGENGSRRRIFN